MHDRPADVDAALLLIAQAARHLHGRASGTLEPAIVRDLVRALADLAYAIDRHRPAVLEAARRGVLEELDGARRARAQLSALVELQRRGRG